MERRLAAILAADVVGYSRLMEQDESGTFTRLRAHRKELFEPEIARHHGRVFKLMGDGLLAEFASAVNAVECAIAVQQGMAERNAGLPNGQRIDCRIGVNLGDVIVETDSGAAMDMHGDGVIIANRLQAIAEPGDVLISGGVYDQLKKKIGAGFKFLGEQKVKNIAEPIRLYRVLLDPAQAGKTIGAGVAQSLLVRWLAVAAVVASVIGALVWLQPWNPSFERASLERMAQPLPDRPSIAVLPFANMSDDPKQEYFADGVTDDLITELSKVSGLFVISRNSTFVYKGRNLPPRQISEELGVRYVLEGSVQRAGNQLRINAQLIDALSGGHAWADRFDGSVDNVFALQDKVTRSIAEALAIRLDATDTLATSQTETTVPAAYDSFLRGMEYYQLTTAQDYARAIPFFEDAIKLDPEYGRAYGVLALLYVRVYSRQYAYDLGITPPEALERAKRYVASARDRSPAAAHQVDGYLAMTMDGNSAEALSAFKEATALNPGDPWNYVLTGWALTGDGRPAEALEYFHTAMRLNPNDTRFLSYWLGLALFGLERFDEAAQTLESVTRANPEDDFAFLLLAATYGHLGRRADAQVAVSQWNAMHVKRGDITLTIDHAPGLALSNSQAYERFMDGLRLAGVPESHTDEAFAAANQLTAEEVRALLFGHRLYSRDFGTGREGTAEVTTDGAIEATGQLAVYSGPTSVRFSGNRLCIAINTNMSECMMVLRNPGGSKEKFNEYIWAGSRGTFPFSQVE